MASPADFDFWQFVCCARCHLPFAGGHSQLPFWLTECGHIVCNNHLNADQSCVQCGERGIQLVPLQKEMDLPMADWFRHAPTALDSVANTVKFQQETLASQVLYYKNKCSRQRALLERMQVDLQQKQKELEYLRREHGQSPQYGAHAPPDAYAQDAYANDQMNSNGKRPRTSAYQPAYSGGSSSPRSIAAPLAPNRLTIPTEQSAPNLGAPRETLSDPAQNVSPANRPGGGQFIEQYAYIPTQTPQFHGQLLSHEQAAPIRETQARNQRRLQRNMMPPPPVPQFSLDVDRSNMHSSRQVRGVMPSAPTPMPRSDPPVENKLAARDRRQMAPPPRPPQAMYPNQQQHQHQHQQPTRVPQTPQAAKNAYAIFKPVKTFGTASTAVRPAQAPMAPPSGPPSNRSNAPGPNQRFVPATPSGGSHRFIPTAQASRAPSTKQHNGYR